MLGRRSVLCLSRMLLLVIPNAPRVQVGVAEVGYSEARPRVKVVRHVGGL